jgi:hypothetical protein
MTKTHLQRALRLVASASVLLAIIACGSSSSDPSSSTGSTSTGSTPAADAVRETRTCDASSTSLGQCIEHDLAEAFSEEAIREQCTSLQGTFGTESCPTEHRIGTCTPNLGHTVRHYYDGDHQYEASTASADCSMLRNGTWAAATP